MKNNHDLWATHFPQFIENRDKGVDFLMDASSLVKLAAGRQLFYPGSLCENYLLVLEGAVKVQIMSESGREVLLYHVRSGDSCVLTTSCMLSGDCYPAEGITESEVTAFAMSSHAFYRCIEQSPFFREFVFKNFSSRLSKLIGRMEAVVFETIDQRICKNLLESGEKLMTKTHQELAYELGSAREVVSRHLKTFESYGWVKLKRGTIDIIDREALIKVCAKR
ncbi:Transcriptional regulator, Crp/Fnr family [Crenothrix polyspora]|uniref:Transcriptional regulator, Crp/Fnr family n=1 Tax=Crenothrix polyspora TaxID=360316 RepID=A0A1R4H3X9_9GAMM|nr:Crp/Fnr family transcriptional regulator [Crenothrix polyspora]SJM90968.1 Transcriptional regulator, Crp/Fnr family [Crenothrix polyspora]